MREDTFHYLPVGDFCACDLKKKKMVILNINLKQVVELGM